MNLTTTALADFRDSVSTPLTTNNQTTPRSSSYESVNFTDAYKQPMEWRNKYWKWLIDDAKERPLRQDQSNKDHFCEPQYKTCSDVLMFSSKGNKIMMLVEVKNTSNALVMRATCVFNDANMDIRTCANLDTGYAWQDMKGEKGWTKISNDEANSGQ